MEIIKEIVVLVVFFLAGFIWGKAFYQSNATKQIIPIKLQAKKIEKIEAGEFSLLVHALIKECSICDPEEISEIVGVFRQRVNDPRFPSTMDSVILQSGAVSCVNRVEGAAYRDMGKVVLEAMYRPLDGKLLGYFRPDTATDTAHVRKVAPLIKKRHRYHVFHTL